jgi:N4-gp56 family major capsid protein
MAQQVWVTNSLGGYFALPWLSRQLRHRAQPIMKFRQFCNVKEAFGKRRGATAMWDKVSNITTAGATLAETSTIPRRNFTITQGSVVITEYGNAIDYTFKLETLSEYGVPEAVQKVLRNDMAKVLDSAAGAIFATGDFVAQCINTASTEFTTDGTATTTASTEVSDKNWRDIIDYMKKKDIPRYAGEDYVAICSVDSLRGLYDYLEATFAYTTREHMYSGEVGRYYSCRAVETTHYLHNTSGGGAIGQAIFFGDDAVWEAISVPEEIRVNVPADFGRDQAMAWYYLGGYAKIWDYTDDGEGHICVVNQAI